MSAPGVFISYNLADGTNVPQDTAFQFRLSKRGDWYLPQESHAPKGWESNWLRLRARLERLIDECRPVSCTVVDKRIPGWPYEDENEDSREQKRKPLAIGSCISSEPCQLVNAAGYPIMGAFAIRDARGSPMCSSAGEPFGFRYGLSRIFELCGTPGGDRENRPQPGSRLRELFGDARGLLYKIPATVAMSIWRNWPYGFTKDNAAADYAWLAALFELAWQRPSGDVLHAKRWAWCRNTSIALMGCGLFPRLPPSTLMPPNLDIPNEYGYPSAWRSEIKDVVRASVLAIDEILERSSAIDDEAKSARPTQQIFPDKQSIAENTQVRHVVTTAAPAVASKIRDPMTTQSAKPIFICYAHRDNEGTNPNERWLERLREHLGPLVHQNLISQCSDEDLELGDHWHARIQEKLTTAKAAVLLVSPAFLNSTYIRNSELPVLLRRTKENGVTIIPILLKPCLFAETKFRYPDPKTGPEEFSLATLQAAGRPSKTLAEMTLGEQDRELLKVAQRLLGLATTNP